MSKQKKKVEEQEQQTYSQWLSCSNCGHSYCEEIPFGAAICDWTSYHGCPNCGCRELNKGFRPKGVTWNKKAKAWRVRIRHNDRVIDTYGFQTKEEAALFYNKQANMFYGEFAKLNVINQFGDWIVLGAIGNSMVE